MSTCRHTVTAAEAVALLNQIRAILFERLVQSNTERLLATDGERVMDPEADMDGEACEYVGAVFEDAGLVPEEIEPTQPLTLAPDAQ